MAPQTRQRKPVPASVPHRPWLLGQLKDPETAAAYLIAAIEENDPGALKLALRNVLDARCKARDADTQRRLHLSLSRRAEVRLFDAMAILSATGLRLAVEPIAA